VRTLEDLIAASGVFAGLSGEHLTLIAGCAVNERFPAGAELFREGAPADRFFLIRSGAVALEVHQPGRGGLLIETFHTGDVVGWSWLFPPYRWEFDGRVVEDTGTVSFDGACLRGKCEDDHELGYQLMKRFAESMTERLQATRLQLLDVYGHAGTR
jgi:CRP/FNR family transcriptional regulator, cyclic AMP receptor protein